MSTIHRLAALLAASVSLSGCMTAGPYNGMPNAPYTAKGAYVSDPEAPPPTAEQIASADRLGKYCNETAKKSLSDPLESEMASGAGYAAAYGAAGASQSLFYSGVGGGAAAGYGAVSGFLGGFVNGRQVYSNANVSMVSGCFRDIMDRRRRNGDDPNLHYEPGYVRTRNPWAGVPSAGRSSREVEQPRPH